MDKRKLIGTIIGVTMFAALIAGATFAWLTFTANVTNGTYNTGARNFVINYTKGTDITSLPMLTISSAADVTSNLSSSGSKVHSLVVKAKLNSTTSQKGNLTLTLYTTSDTGTFVSSEAIRYSVSINGGTPTAPQRVTKTTLDLVLSGTSTTTYLIDSTTDDTFTVYFWLDAATITNAMMGKSYAANLRASAKQTES